MMKLKIKASPVCALPERSPPVWLCNPDTLGGPRVLGTVWAIFSVNHCTALRNVTVCAPGVAGQHQVRILRVLMWFASHGWRWGQGRLVMLVAFWADSAVAVERMASWLGPVWTRGRGTEPVSSCAVIRELRWGHRQSQRASLSGRRPLGWSGRPPRPGFRKRSPRGAAVLWFCLHSTLSPLHPLQAPRKRSVSRGNRAAQLEGHQTPAVTSPGRRASRVSREPWVWVPESWLHLAASRSDGALSCAGSAREVTFVPAEKDRQCPSAWTFQSLLWPSSCPHNAAHGRQKRSSCPMPWGQSPADGTCRWALEGYRVPVGRRGDLDPRDRPHSVPLTVRVGIQEETSCCVSLVCRPPSRSPHLVPALTPDPAATAFPLWSRTANDYQRSRL